jgi:hypothetical protein
MQHITDYRDMPRVISWINIDCVLGQGTYAMDNSS